MKKVAYLLLLLFSIQLLACQSESSDDVNQDRIYTVYDLSYGADKDETVASARFHFGSWTGTRLELSDESSILFNGKYLSFNKTLVRYSTSFQGEVLSGDFVFTDANGKTYTNSITINSIAVDPTLTSISRSATTAPVLIWQGPPLNSDESVTLTLSDSSLLQEYKVNTTGADRIVLDQGFNNFKTNEVEVRLERFYFPPLQEMTEAEGSFSGYYEARKSKISLTP